MTERNSSKMTEHKSLLQSIYYFRERAHSNDTQALMVYSFEDSLLHNLKMKKM